MLYITRKESERVVINNEIEVEILKIEDDGVRIGITAPADVSVHRYEVFRKITAANRVAARSKRSATALRGLLKVPPASDSKES